LAPLSNPEEIAKLPGEWATALTKIFDRFTPIVIGYGGNDGSLMGFLKKHLPIEGGVFWCHREGDVIDPTIEKVVEHHDGYLVPIAGFDEVMLQLQETLQLKPPVLQLLKNVQDKRVVDYQKQFEALTAKLAKPAASEEAEKAREPVRKAVEAAIQRLTKEKSWWAWELKAGAESDPARREAIYRDGLKDFPMSAELANNFALFIQHVRKDYDEAERLYRKALGLDPNSAVATGNFARFMQYVRKDYKEA
jgi:tetratricopeptide (TPR) repeat protein